MTDSKYELKSSDLQELMSKVPHSFIVWGNMFVFVFLVFSMYMLNGFNIDDKKAIAVRIVSIERRGSSADSLEIVLGTHDLEKISKNQVITLHFGPQESRLQLKGRVTKLHPNEQYESLLYTFVDGTRYVLHPGMTGQGVVVLQKTSFLANLVKSSFNK